MTGNSFIQITLYVVTLLALAKPLGGYMARIYEGESVVNRWFAPLEGLLYRISGVSPKQEMRWTEYAIALLIFNLLGALAVFALQRLPAGVASMISLLAPVIGVLAAWVELAEVPSRLELTGMILIASALAIIAIHSMRKHEEVDPAIGQE